MLQSFLQWHWFTYVYQRIGAVVLVLMIMVAVVPVFMIVCTSVWERCWFCAPNTISLSLTVFEVIKAL